MKNNKLIDAYLKAETVNEIDRINNCVKTICNTRTYGLDI